MIAYLDSSVLLRIIVGQPGQLPEWHQIERGIVSALVEVECLRALDRLRLQGSFSDEEPRLWGSDVRLYCLTMKRLAVLSISWMTLAACGGGSADPAAPLPTYEEREVLWVNPDELHDWIEAGHADDVVFVDNRTQFVYEEQHIEGARLISTDIIDEAIGTLPLNKWLIMYCT